jgi:tripartite ATP-independent transporter DctM subunit
MILLFGLMLVFILIGMEIGTAMGFTGMVYILLSWLGPTPIALSVIPQNFVYGADSFPFLAMPLFILAGELMNAGGVTHQLVRVSQALVGHITGGLGNVSVVANVIMAGMSGSSVADASATGSVMIPAMKRAKYPPEMAAAVIGASATIGPIIPPSIPFVIIGSMTGTSIGRLFLGGFLPGCFMGLLLLITNYFVAKRKGLVRERRFDWKELFRSVWEGILSLLMPPIIIGSIIFGIATPTEAAGVAVAYALFLGFVIYRKLTFGNTLEILKRCAIITASLTFTIAGASVISWVAISEQMGPKMTMGLLSITNNPIFILFIINGILFVLGFPIEPLPLTMMLIPILFPVIIKLGIDPVHFVVIFVVNVQLALITPPVGASLFVVSALAQTSVAKVSRALIPYLIGLLVSLVIITIWPGLTLWLPNLLMK